MLLRFLSHVVGLDVPWLVDDLLGDFLVMVGFSIMFLWIFDDYKGYRDILFRHTAFYIFAWGILDVMQLTGWTSFAHVYFLEFIFFQFAVAIMLANTRFAKHGTAIIAGGFFLLSWLVS